MVTEKKDDLSDTELVQEEEQFEETIAELKQVKARAKTVFTKSRRNLLVTIQQENVSREEIKEACEILDTAQDDAMDAMMRLSNKYIANKDSRSSERLIQEIDKIEIEYTDAQNRAQQVFDELSRAASYSKFIKKLEDTSQKQGSDLVKSKDDQTFSSHREELLHQPEYILESATKYGDTQLYAAEPQSVLYSQPAVVKISNEEPAVPLINSDNGQRKNVTDSALIGQDLWKQLKRVTIPVFSGDKKTYQNWKAAFTACVDQAPATAEYKLLQLRQCLAGEALRSIESLGHSATAYQAAKERLERKFGGQRCQIALYLEEIDNFRPIRPGNPKDIEKYADLLDIAIVNLKEVNRSEELRDGLLYMKLQKKLPASMLASYHRWMYENHKEDSVEVLREWAIQESEFQTRALETIQGLNAGRFVNKVNRETPHTYFGRSNFKPEFASEFRAKRTCKVCGKQHGVWVCEDFKQLDTPKRWECAKKFKLCFRCLGEGHLGQHCNRTKVCGQSGCREVHHQLLHKDQQSGEVKFIKSSQQKEGEHGNDKDKDTPEERTESLRVDSSSEGEQKSNNQKARQQDTTMMSETTGNIALRTVPVYIKNGNRKLKVNALLDDASTKTYINSDVAAELGLQGCLQKVNVSVLNGQMETFETSPVECVIESLDGKANLKVTAFTVDRVTGNMKATDWNVFANKWPHLKSLQFHKLGS